MSVLSVDTAAPVVGAAVLGGKSWEQRILRGADVALAQAMVELLEGQQVSLVCVSVGPGAFTSLRVGVAAALGFAVARGIPVLPIGSLQARALLVPIGPTLAILDGRKAKAYAQSFQDAAPIGPGADLPPDQAIQGALETLGAGFLAVGEGAEVWSAQIQAAGGTVSSDPCRSPVVEMAEYAWKHRAQAVSPQAVRLEYLREADAKLPTPKA
ncbi:MAG: tRNA threonylcarbamoyladenosine biosynthesis protein TsaB [Cognaticolwellia sp.]|jgi:tRNA threonylcarbamoyladenosine biosynthesis protein TsaB